MGEGPGVVRVGPVEGRIFGSLRCRHSTLPDGVHRASVRERAKRGPLQPRGQRRAGEGGAAASKPQGRRGAAGPGGQRGRTRELQTVIWAKALLSGSAPSTAQRTLYRNFDNALKGRPGEFSWHPD